MPAATNLPKTCPECGTNFQGEEIPEANRKFYGDGTHYSRLYGIEVRGVYDGVLYWQCPECGHAFPRGFEDRRMILLARAYADKRNEESPVPFERAMCPDCTRSVAVRNGALVPHSRPVEAWELVDPAAPAVQPCAGSGRPRTEAYPLGSG
jgi:ribosomal protein S27AE